MELNGVFYRTPTPEAVGCWRDETGRHFVFSWKASKFISHWKRLSENSINSLQLLDDRLPILGDKVGPILFQLPPDFAADASRLGAFLILLPAAPLLGVGQYLECGALVEILPDFRRRALAVSLVVAHRSNLSRRVRAFMKWIEDVLTPYLE